MDEADEKMSALKRAYADIILNMAKESAARIMASERKALRFQQELFRAKEEAVGTLIRVKGIMDSKINEAESMSFNQMRRIQELEVQLGEAENMIKYLKNELNRSNEDTKKGQMGPLDRQYTAAAPFAFHECVCQKALGQKTANGQSCFSFENTTQGEQLDDFSSKDNCVGDPDLTSIIMRNKEPELYRNGCTQRVRAFEQNSLTRKVPLGQPDDQSPKNNFSICENEITEVPCISEPPEADRMLPRTKTTNGSRDTAQHGGSSERGQVLIQRFSLQRKRTRIKRMKANASDANNQLVANNEPSERPTCNASGGNKMIEPGEITVWADGEAPQETNSILDPVPNNSCRDSEDGRSNSESCVNENRPIHSKGQNKVHVESVVNGSYSKSDDKIYQNTSSNAENMDHETIISDQHSKPDKISGVISEGSVRNKGSGTLEPQDASNQGKDENLDNSVCKSDSVKTHYHLLNPESVNGKGFQTNGASSQGASDRLLKYTFRRKRKREPSTSVEKNAIPEKRITSHGTSGDKQSDLPEPQKPMLLTRSSRDSRRIVQVARQLISLSEKRW